MIPQTFIQYFVLRKEIEHMNEHDQKIALEIYEKYWQRGIMISERWSAPLMLSFLFTGISLGLLALFFGKVPWFAGLTFPLIALYFLIFSSEKINRRICKDYYREKEEKQKMIDTEICTDPGRKRIFEIMREVFNSRKNTFE
jgi:hypothetical protein